MRTINGLAAATTNVELGANLDAGQAAYTGAYAAGDMADYGASSGVTGVQPHLVTRRCRSSMRWAARTRSHDAFLAAAAANTWNVEVYADTAEVEAAAHPDGLLGEGTVTFNWRRHPDERAEITPELPSGSYAWTRPVGINWLDTSGPNDSAITFDLGTADSADGLSQFSSDYNIAFVQPERRRGRRAERRHDRLAEGYVIARFTNGATQKIYKLPLATFANPLALDPRTGNVYAQTSGSGEFNLRDAGRRRRRRRSRRRRSKAANVDLADEFTKMIVTQRAYSANARIITTADEMLDELIRISR